MPLVIMDIWYYLHALSIIQSLTNTLGVHESHHQLYIEKAQVSFFIMFELPVRVA
jgi:hypothetical protein